MTGPLVSAVALLELIDPGRPAPTVLDVRWDLATGPRRDLYEQGHIPTAEFVDLDRELAGPAGAGGRHPLPPPRAFQAAMREKGVDDDRPVVVYDDARADAAARAWWLLRYFSHRTVRVLDGGLAAWREVWLALEMGRPARKPRGGFKARPGGMSVLDASGASALAQTGILLDARAPERFRGESEPIDPVAGHIPHARNRPSSLNVDPDGRFHARDRLRAELERIGVNDEVEIGAYCGSGVSAAQEVLALAIAGYDAALYPGSWSEWVTDPTRPVETGDEDRSQPGQNVQT
jgi:thiosulfate/3-mercaptopyruvate sulfurtransferase